MRYYAKAILALLFAFLVPGAGLVFLGATVVGSAFTVTTLGVGVCGNFLPFFLPPGPAAWVYLACRLTLSVLWLAQFVLTVRRTMALRDAGANATRFPLAAAVTFVSMSFLMAIGSLRSRYGVAPFHVSTDAMAPAVLAGDRILLRALPAGSPNEALRGKMVLYRRADAPVPAEGFALQRVVAIPGDRVVVGEDCSVRVAGEVVVPVPAPSAPTAFAPCQPFEGVVPEQQLFLVGDAKDPVADSRREGPVPETQLVGRPFVVWFSRASTEGGLFRRVGHPIP
jgi:signal peptidase I